MDPIDPAFLDRSFGNDIRGLPRVERVRELRDDQPGESFEEEQKHAREQNPDEEADFYEPSQPPAETVDEAGDEQPPADPDSVVVDLEAPEQPPDRGDDDGLAGPHIDISV